MHVLIANDDGIFAPGLRALAEAAQAAGHKVSIFAPDSQRSAASHAITLTRPLHVRKVEYGGMDAYAVDGTPADCARLGLYIRKDDPVEFVLSGINRGSNRGGAILYSGTVAAAMEAAMCGVPGLAVSLCSEEDADYTAAAQLGVRTMEWAVAHPLPHGEIYNLNVPAGSVKGVRAATVSHDFIAEPAYVLQADGGYSIGNGKPLFDDADENCDLRLTEAGYASLSVLTWNLMAQTPIAALDGLEDAHGD